jgi:Holliday junction resolvasome RuvABC endonuclease subunit
MSTLEEIRGITAWENIIIIDPGSEGTGWCLWRMADAAEPKAHGVLTSRARTWRERMEDITTRFSNEVLASASPDRMLLEWPEMWSGSVKSQASASTGKLLKLAALCGALELVAVQHIPEVSLFVSANEWKGQLEKQAVNFRIRRALGRSYPNHAADAVGIGLAVLGLLN